MNGDRPTLRSHGAAEGAGGASAVSAPATDHAAAGPSWTSWRNLWQVPTIALSVALIAIGVRSAIRPAMGHDFDGAMAQVEGFIAAGQIEQAYAQMRGAIEPNIDKATLPQQARFHAASADLTYVSQETSGLQSDANNRHIVEQYALAEELGFVFSPARRERWGEALLDLDDFEGVEKQLDHLRNEGGAKPPASERAESHEPKPPTSEDGHAAPPPPEPKADEHATAAAPHDDGSDALKSHGRLFRRMIEMRLRRTDLDATRLLEMLAEYRLSGAANEHERLWVTARLAELRLETGDADAAVNGLLVEMRRLETESISPDGAGYGELYLLLGRGYHDLADTPRAQAHLQRALELLSSSEPARGEALTLLGRMALAAGDHDTAYERFGVVANDFVGTRSHLPALLGKAECESLMGDHASAQSGFREVAALLRKDSARRDVTAAMVAARLCDRHDAALAMGRMERALEYVEIAETMFAVDAVPGPVLIRLASTNRQIAEDLLASAGHGEAAAPDSQQALEPADIDPAVRYEANRRLLKAAHDYLRHTSAESDEPLSEDAWAASLWYAAECFDRGGSHREAIEQFEKYLGSRPPDDPRKAEAMFRIAQARQAMLEYGEAALAYEQLLADRSRSSFAARCFVPLARCYLALNRPADARKTLEEVLSGERLLDPEANDYRDALVELGRLHHDQREFVAAIERLTEAIDRYPQDERRVEVQSLLAESYRSNAADIAKRLTQDTGLSPAEHGRLTALRNEHLQQAEQIFGEIVAAHAPQPGVSVPPTVQDLVRRAHLYQADCAFELGQFDAAVEMYESASRQYSSAASSMYALVQIVNCYAALGDAERAAAAHQRALLRLKQLPDAAFASPDALMDRAAWERWLRNSPVGGTAPAGGERVAGATDADASH